MAASSDGRRSVTVSVNTELTPEAGEPGAFKALRRVEALAVCAALAEDKPSKERVVGKRKSQQRLHASCMGMGAFRMKTKAHR